MGGRKTERHLIQSARRGLVAGPNDKLTPQAPQTLTCSGVGKGKEAGKAGSDEVPSTAAAWK